MTCIAKEFNFMANTLAIEYEYEFLLTAIYNTGIRTVKIKIGSTRFSLAWWETLVYFHYKVI